VRGEHERQAAAGQYEYGSRAQPGRAVAPAAVRLALLKRLLGALVCRDAHGIRRPVTGRSRRDLVPLGPDGPVGLRGTIPLSLGRALPLGLRRTIPLSLGRTIPLSLRRTIPLSLRRTIPLSLGRAIPLGLRGTIPLSLGRALPVSLRRTIPVSLRRALPLSLRRRSTRAI